MCCCVLLNRWPKGLGNRYGSGFSRFSFFCLLCRHKARKGDCSDQFAQSFHELGLVQKTSWATGRQRSKENVEEGTYIHLCTCMYLYMNLHVCIYIHIYKYVYIYIYTYIHIYLYIFMYVHHCCMDAIFCRLTVKK